MARFDKLQQLIRDFDFLFVDDPIDLFYLTGLSLSKGRLVAFSDRAILFVDGRYVERAKREAPCLVQSTGLEQLLSKYRKGAFDSLFTSFEEHRLLQNQFPHIEWVPLPKPLKELRLFKEESEIAALRKASQLTAEGMRYLLPLFKEGVTEEELALEFEIFCRRKGASRLSFSPIIAFGENSAYPHYRAGKAKLQRDQIVLIDVGAVVDAYAGDSTRVFFFGRPHQELNRLYQLVQRAQKKAIAAIRPGVRLGELERLAREELQQEEKFFVHGLGHGIGLETHEYPRLKEDVSLILKPGMVFTIEPGLYYPGLGGVRCEDAVLVTETGCDLL